MFDALCSPEELKASVFEVQSPELADIEHGNPATVSHLRACYAALGRMVASSRTALGAHELAVVVSEAHTDPNMARLWSMGSLARWVNRVRLAGGLEARGWVATVLQYQTSDGMWAEMAGHSTPALLVLPFPDEYSRRQLRGFNAVLYSEAGLRKILYAAQVRGGLDQMLSDEVHPSLINFEAASLKLDELFVTSITPQKMGLAYPPLFTESGGKQAVRAFQAHKKALCTGAKDSEPIISERERKCARCASCGHSGALGPCGQCCSAHGWCGNTPAHCTGNGSSTCTECWPEWSDVGKQAQLPKIPEMQSVCTPRSAEPTCALDVPMFAISLKDHPRRISLRKHVAEVCPDSHARNALVFVDAVTKSEEVLLQWTRLSEAEIAVVEDRQSSRFNDLFMSRIETAVALSHLRACRRALKHLVTHGGDVALVLEDDAKFDFVPYWPAASIREWLIAADLPKDWLTVKLGATAGDVPPAPWNADLPPSWAHLVQEAERTSKPAVKLSTFFSSMQNDHWMPTVWGVYGNLYSRKGLEVLKSHFWAGTDDSAETVHFNITSLERFHLSDWLIPEVLNASSWAAVPPLIIHPDDADTTINDRDDNGKDSRSGGSTITDREDNGQSNTGASNNAIAGVTDAEDSNTTDTAPSSDRVLTYVGASHYYTLSVAQRLWCDAGPHKQLNTAQDVPTSTQQPEAATDSESHWFSNVHESIRADASYRLKLYLPTKEVNKLQLESDAKHTRERIDRLGKGRGEDEQPI